MATIDNYKIKITVEGQEKVVDLMDNLNTLQTGLNRTAAAGVAAFSALAASAIKMADSLNDLSDATGISIGKIYQLSTALEASGGNFDDSGKFLQAFSRTLGEVEQGSTNAIESLTQLGLSRDQIQNLSDEQLFKAAVDGLAGMEDGFAKTKIAMDLFGKSAASVDFQKLSEGLQGSVDPEIERNLILAADAVQTMEVAFRNLQIAALAAVAPILQNIKDLNITTEDAKKVIQVLGAIIAGAFAASTVIQITKIVQLMKELGGVTRAAAAAQAFLVGLSGVGLAVVAAAGVAATAAYVALGKAMENAADEKERLETPAQEPGAIATPGAGRTIGVTPEERALAAIKEQTRQLKEKNNEANRYARVLLNTIGLSEQEVNLIKTMADLEQQAANQKLDIQRQIDAELAKGSEANQAIVTELQNQLLEVDRQLGIQKELKQEELSRLQIQKDITNEIERQAERNAAIFEFGKQKFLDAVKIQEAQGKLTERQAEIASKIGIANLKYYDTLAKLEADLEKAEIQGDLAAIDRIQNLMNINKERWRFELESIAEQQAAETIRQQNYIKGMEDAMVSIAKAFTPYQMAQDSILKTWGNISSAVDDFVRTGKFKFSDFARSVIRDLAAMILKAQIFKAISGIAGAFGLTIPGLAKGGPVAAGQPYIVGEKGPELFVPPSAGKIIPNNQLAASKPVASGTVNAPVTNVYNTYNINAVDAKSVAQLFTQNRKSLLGAMTMAQKEMPYSVTG